MNEQNGSMTDPVQIYVENQEKRSLLGEVPLFAALPGAELQHLADALQWRVAPAGTVLFLEGDLGDSLDIVVDGQIEIVKALGTPDEHVLAVVGAGDFLGEMSMFYQDGERSASARALTGIKLLELTRAEFNSVLKRRPELAITILQRLSIRLRNIEDATILDLQQKNRQLAQAYLDLQAAQTQIIEKEKMEHELRMARKIQESILLREMPEVEGWKFSAYWNPARAVSGDFYDFVVFPDGKVAILIGDVTDKGVPAALVMATTRSVLRVAAKKGLSPSEVLRQVNELLYPDMPPKMFVTCLCAMLDPASGHLLFANAGQDLPHQLSRNGPVELRATGMPLGLMPGMSYEENETILQPGEKIVLFSDGLIEAHNSQRAMFGLPRLRGFLVEYLEKTGQDGQQNSLIEFLMEKLHEFTGSGWEQEDDVTIVLVERA